MQAGRRTKAVIEAEARALASLTRPDPFEDMPDTHKEVWRAVVEDEDPLIFKSAAARLLLREYCAHVVTVTELGRLIDEFESQERGTRSVMLNDYLKMVNLRQRESTMATSKATKLRLTNQSKFNPNVMAALSKKSVRETGAAAGPKPWET